MSRTLDYWQRLFAAVGVLLVVGGGSPTIGSSSAQSRRANAAVLSRLLPGDPSIDSSQLRPYRAVYDFSDGRAEVTLEETVVDGIPALNYVSVLKIRRGDFNDENVFRRDDLTPLSAHAAYNTNKSLVVDYQRQKNGFLVEGEFVYRDASPRQSVTATLDHLVFGHALTLYPCLPLEAGYTKEIPVASKLTSGGEVRWKHFTVVGREKVRAANRTFDTWKIQSDGGIVWVIDEPPYVIKRRLPRGGSVWTLKSFKLLHD